MLPELSDVLVIAVWNGWWKQWNDLVGGHSLLENASTKDGFVICNYLLYWHVSIITLGNALAAAYYTLDRHPGPQALPSLQCVMPFCVRGLP